MTNMKPKQQTAKIEQESQDGEQEGTIIMDEKTLELLENKVDEIEKRAVEVIHEKYQVLGNLSDVFHCIFDKDEDADRRGNERINDMLKKIEHIRFNVDF